MRESVAVLRPRSPYSRNAHYEVNARVRCSPSSAVAVLPKCALRGKCASPLQSFVRGRLLRPRRVLRPRSPYSRNAHYEVKCAVVAVLRPRSPYSRNAHYEVNARVRCSPSFAVAVLPKCALRVLRPVPRNARSSVQSFSRNAHYEVNARVRCSPSSAVAVLPKCALRGKCASPLQSFVRGRRTPEMRITSCSPSSAVAVLPKCALRGKCASPLQSFVRGRRTPEMRITSPSSAFAVLPKCALRGKCASPLQSFVRGRRTPEMRVLRSRSPYSRNAHYEVNARVRCSPSSAVAVLPKCALRGKCRCSPSSAVAVRNAKCALRGKSFFRGRRTPEMRITSPSSAVAVENAHYEVNARVRCSPSSAVAVLPKCALRGKCASPLQSFVRGRLLRPRSPYSRNAHYEVNARVRCSPSSAVAVLPKCALRKGKCASPLQSFVRGRLLRPRSPYSRNAHYEVNARVRCGRLPEIRGRRSPYSRNAHYEVNARVRCSPSSAVAVLPKCALRGKCASPLQSFVRGRRTPEMRITSPSSAVAVLSRNAHYEVNASPSPVAEIESVDPRVLRPRSPYSRNAHYEVNARVRVGRFLKCALRGKSFRCSPSAVAVLPKCALRGKCASPLQSFVRGRRTPEMRITR
ncbi:unnamed protein product [Acanthosepion pharaonis]|uniref:Uncharacterized protein n=1 Tax=Acanthosepion pharaonis TaxID=158019 RepID=A0A812EEZ1_ACAPH|nr:unnamed protein product [Sepia pharaonis]